MSYDLCGKRVWVAGHGGMVGSALVRALEGSGASIITADRSVDLRRQAVVEMWMEETRPDAVFLAAAKVGGILANQASPADFFYDNVMISTNVIESARQVGVEKLLFLGSSCIYPRLAPQPIPEDALMTGPVEPTNAGYAMAKIAGVKMCEFYARQHGCRFISAMPTNLYGPGDNIDPQTSHVIPSLMNRMHGTEGPVTIWGTGSARREFMHVDDLADALVFLMRTYEDPAHINVGVGEDVSIRELAEEVARVTGYTGEIMWDTTKPDGMPRKLMNSARLADLGWKPSIGLSDGLRATYEWFKREVGTSRAK